MDTKKPLNYWSRNCSFKKINEHEYENSKTIFRDIDYTLYSNLIITLGSKGCRYKDKIYGVEKVDVKDMTGAGDTFLAGLVFEYVKSGDIEKAIKFAQECTTKVVQKHGVSTV